MCIAHPYKVCSELAPHFDIAPGKFAWKKKYAESCECSWLPPKRVNSNRATPGKSSELSAWFAVSIFKVQFRRFSLWSNPSWCRSYLVVLTSINYAFMEPVSLPQLPMRELQYQSISGRNVIRTVRQGGEVYGAPRLHGLVARSK